MTPFVAAEAPEYIGFYKPPRMHTAPLSEGEENNLLDWAGKRFPEILRIHGRKEIEGGLVNRLDYETQGLVLCARTEKMMKLFLEQQEKNAVIKEYDAVSECTGSGTLWLPGFPPAPSVPCNEPIIIESAFRPYGMGRKSVRPVLYENSINKNSALYRTEILSAAEIQGKCFYRIRIVKGFRHQIRSHLAWVKRPLLNDFLYGTGNDNNPGYLALRASSISFYIDNRPKVVLL